jgi:release factor glutamine methyltransferase
MRIDEALKQATERLRAVSDSPRLDAEVLLTRALDVRSSYLIAHPEDTLDDAAIERYEQTVARRADGVPLPYITGEREFWSLSLMVGPETLVPRPETELLVELALRELSRYSGKRVLDLGTGSGAIALAIASERPLCSVTATDLSAAALAIAQQNARQLELANVTFALGNWAEAVAGRRFDLIVSNPPYVREGDPAMEALRHEPKMALVAGSDGLDAIRVLARDCRGLLDRDGVLLLEHGADQEEAVAQLLRENGWTGIECFRDPGGRPRVTRADMDGPRAGAGSVKA